MLHGHCCNKQQRDTHMCTAHGTVQYSPLRADTGARYSATVRCGVTLVHSSMALAVCAVCGASRLLLPWWPLAVLLITPEGRPARMLPSRACSRDTCSCSKGVISCGGAKQPVSQVGGNARSVIVGAAATACAQQHDFLWHIHNCVPHHVQAAGVVMPLVVRLGGCVSDAAGAQAQR